MEELIIEFLGRGLIMLGGHFIQKKIKKIWKNFTEKTVNIKDIYGAEILQVIIEENPSRSKQIRSIFTSQEYSAICTGQGKLTVDQINKLSNELKISPAVFFPELFNSKKVQNML